MTQIPHTDTLHTDGYRATERTPLHSEHHVLHMELIVSGDRQVSVPVYKQLRDRDGTAAFTRAHALFEAICRYKNSGGTNEELWGFMDVLEKLPDVSLPPEIGSLICSTEQVTRWDYYCNEAGEYWRSCMDDFSEPISAEVMYDVVERGQLPVYVEF